MRHSIKFSHSFSKIYLRLYKAARKLGMKSPTLEAFLETEELQYLTKHPSKIEGYKFHDTDLTLSALYEYKDMNRVFYGLRKLGRKHRSQYCAGYDLTGDRLEETYKKFLNPADQRTAKIGTIKFSAGELDGKITEIEFSIESLGNDFFMLNAILHISDEIAKEFDKDRQLLQTTSSLGLNIISIKKKLWITHSTRSINYVKFYSELTKLTRIIDAFLFNYLNRPLETVCGSITLYETSKKADEVSKDFAKADVAYCALNDGFEKMYIEGYEEFKFVRIFKRVTTANLGTIHASYHNNFFDNYNPVFYGIAFYEYIDRIRDEVYGLLSHSSSESRVQKLFKRLPFNRVKDLQSRSMKLSKKRYYLATIRNLLDSYVWQRYIARNKYYRGVAGRQYKQLNSKIDYIKEHEKWLQTNITLSERLIDTGIQQFKSDLEIQNTASNNKLSRVLLWLSVLAVVLTAAGSIVQLYPSSARELLCDNNLYCGD